MKRGLGRGLESLIPTQVVETEFDPTAKNESGKRVGEFVLQLDPAKIEPNPHQPRVTFDEAALAGLADSIRHHGILQPLVVSQRGGDYQLIAGERRLRAAKLLKLSTVPAIVRSFDEQEKLELALIENIQRQDLNPMELATAFRKLIDQFNLNQDQVGERVGKDRTTVANTLRLLNLPHNAKTAMAEGKITEGHARAILSISDPSKQQTLLEEIIKNNWTVRQAEEFGRGFKTAGDKEHGLKRLAETNLVTESLSKYLKAKVSLQHNAKGVRLIIQVKDENELERISKLING